MNDLFLMGDADIAKLRRDVAMQRAIGQPRAQMPASTYRSSQGTMQVLRIHGPVLSRPSWLSQLLGLRTTEEHLDNLSSMLSTGGDVLLDIDSPGGDGHLAFEFADMIRSGGDRVTAYTGGYAASAGMLFLTSASKSFAHRSATLGSIGVVGFCNFSDDANAIYSNNARNKKPSRDTVQRDINRVESLFLDYVATATGMTTADVIKRGNQGDIFSGQSAVASGFIDGTTTLQNLTTGKPDQQTQQMAAFVAQQMTANPKIGVNELLANYLALNPNTGTPAASKKQQPADDDWQARLEFIKTRKSQRSDTATAQSQHRAPGQSVTGSDWESRLEFIKQYARSGCA